MPDDLPSLGLAIGGILASKDLLNKLLGPTAEYLGENLKGVVERSAKNTARILQVAYGKLKDRLGDNGQVPPRVLKGVIDEGRFVEDALATEYFGGLLASSRSETGDDTVLPYVNLVKSMPLIQLT